ncbi:MAG: hypothetical protein QW412_00445 [Candidatus Aenigmatarchaeota archaeon]
MKVVKLIFFSLLFLCLSLTKVLADGVLFARSYEREEWLPSIQTQQISVIDFSDEKEGLLISIKGDLKGEKLVWLFPIPAEPQSVKIDVIKNFPTLVVMK